MQDVVVRRHVAAPVQQVWQVATDLTGSPQVLRGVDAVEVLTPGPFDVGTRWRETRTMMGRSATEEMTVTAVEPQRSYRVEAAGRGAHYVSTLAFAPSADGGTDVTMTFGGRPTSTVARVLGAVTAPLGRRAVAKALQQDLDDIAAAAERA
ncbi:SRPBCC family protein [Blastococcus sp. MG754426]|uniref:SRPBCC family protein n=1 Tax=unclassified Blastococcus TaxID=2619396 RepID=UPI001EF12DA6|nr:MULTISPECIES: SRPBCC family protein [unclassified Blastococcus]MCF6506194.1 SRPBCC family protein [Blastococcus sp. MG754426]MCF6510428.1 SRPBCC family protein [Blastococcus sp. MG754427]MCF6737641.1 SRPBCC family protein [Blastococcus sp. KM273129]